MGRVLWHCCPGTARLSTGTPGLETKSQVPGFPEAEMANAFVKISPCVAEEEKDVQVCSPGWGDTGDFAHLTVPLSAEREVRQ